MNLLINQTTAFAIDILSHYTQGIVHSVYRRTINLSFNGQLLALQADCSPVSPISFITSLSSSEMENLNIAIGDLVVVSKNKLTIVGNHENYSFRYGQAKVHKTHFSPDLRYDEVEQIRTTIQQILKDSNTNGFDLIFNGTLNEDSPLAIQVAEKKIEILKNHLNEARFLEAAEEAVKLIGLGSGLTPSGDDFLCGLLAGSIMLQKEQYIFINQLKTAIKEHLNDTIDISAAFLSCALQNEFSLAVNSLGTLPSYLDMRKSFLAIGHSSGIDTLCGVYFALDILR